MPLLGEVHVWPQVICIYVSTILGHQMVLPGGTSELRSVVCMLVHSFLRSVLSTLIPFLAQVSCIYVRTILCHQIPLMGCNLNLGQLCLALYHSCLMSVVSMLVPFFATRCLYQGVHLSWACLIVNVKLTLCLPVNVKLTLPLTKCQAGLM